MTLITFIIPSKTLLITLLCLITLLFVSTGRKEDETDLKWMEKERERAAKEREREDRGKATQM